MKNIFKIVLIFGLLASADKIYSDSHAYFANITNYTPGHEGAFWAQIRNPSLSTKTAPVHTIVNPTRGGNTIYAGDTAMSPSISYPYWVYINGAKNTWIGSQTSKIIYYYNPADGGYHVANYE